MQAQFLISFLSEEWNVVGYRIALEHNSKFVLIQIHE
jgi:hypothetical protein